MQSAVCNFCRRRATCSGFREPSGHQLLGIKSYMLATLQMQLLLSFPPFLSRFPAHDELGTDCIHLHGATIRLLLTIVHHSSFILVRVLGAGEECDTPE